MKIPQAVLGAVLVGLAVQTTGCSSKNDPKPKQTSEQEAKKSGEASKEPINCPACGLG
ncbi:chryseobasin-related MNIO class RiPP peptide [Hymenobacter swuensis]|uniref:Uncharacterized protein n=1 Tax=Hymenobacter swuensis DY53 TaxID=1227739 RepID=W8F5G4_9BACT|nr:hypothetical protein [Hymenobacter swuensis]AHJ96965.1 hypothetical protein Hsw_1370 [Hymenobacter swuensis DY53]